MHKDARLAQVKALTMWKGYICSHCDCRSTEARWDANGSIACPNCLPNVYRGVCHYHPLIK